MAATWCLVPSSPLGGCRTLCILLVLLHSPGSWADTLCVLGEQELPAARSHSSPGQVLGAKPCPCEWGGRDSSAAAGTHLCCSGNWELWTCPAHRLQQGLLCVIVPSFKLNYFASTSFLHFSEGGRGCAKNVELPLTEEEN